MPPPRSYFLFFLLLLHFLLLFLIPFLLTPFSSSFSFFSQVHNPAFPYNLVGMFSGNGWIQREGTKICLYPAGPQSSDFIVGLLSTQTFRGIISQYLFACIRFRVYQRTCQLIITTQGTRYQHTCQGRLRGICLDIDGANSLVLVVFPAWILKGADSLEREGVRCSGEPKPQPRLLSCPC